MLDTGLSPPPAQSRPEGARRMGQVEVSGRLLSLPMPIFVPSYLLSLRTGPTWVLFLPSSSSSLPFFPCSREYFGKQPWSVTAARGKSCSRSLWHGTNIKGYLKESYFLLLHLDLWSQVLQSRDRKVEKCTRAKCAHCGHWTGNLKPETWTKTLYGWLSSLNLAMFQGWGISCYQVLIPSNYGD